MTVRVTRKFTFEAAHFLPGHPTCGNMHGHSYKMEVTFAGEVNPVSGMIVDFGDIKSLVASSVIDKVDHKILNEWLESLYSVQGGTYTTPRPTTEVLVCVFAAEIRRAVRRRIVEFKDVTLHSIKLWETENSYATWEASDDSDDK